MPPSPHTTTTTNSPDSSSTSYGESSSSSSNKKASSKQVKVGNASSSSSSSIEASSSSTSSPKSILKKSSSSNNHHTSSGGSGFGSPSSSGGSSRKNSTSKKSRTGSSSSSSSRSASFVADASSSFPSASQNNGKIKFTAPLGKDPEKARRALLEASSDALGVHRRTFVRRSTMCLKLIVFLAFAVTLAFLSQQITSIYDLVAEALSQENFVRSTADGKPIQAGAVVSFTAGGVQQGHGPIVGVAVSSLPCDPESTPSRLSSRIFFINGNSSSSAVVSAAASKSTLAYWMIDSSISDDNENEKLLSVNTASETAGASAHVALAGVGSSTTNDGSYSKSSFMVIAGAASGGSSVYLHLVSDPSSVLSTTTSVVLASYFTTTSSTDRSTAFLVSIPPPSSSASLDEVAVAGYVCGENTCCIDLISWQNGAVLSGSDGPRLNLPRCPTHAVHFPSTNSSSSEISHVVLPTIPVIVLTINVTASTIIVEQVLKLPITFAGSTASMALGNTSDSQVRVTSIPPPHSKKSVLVTVALQDMFQVFQLFPATTSSSSEVFFIPTLYATLGTASLSGPVSLSGVVFSSPTSIASIYFRDANKFQYMMQLSFVSNGGEASIPRLLPTIGGAEIEFLWLSEVWRHTMLILRETPKFCGLRSVEWQGGLNFAGIAMKTVEAGQSVDVFTGGIVRIFANLIPGTRYSVGVNGSLVAEHDGLALRSGNGYSVVGKAFSQTELYLFPLQP